MSSNVDEPMICNPLVVYQVYLLRKLTFSGDQGFVATLSKHPVNANEDNCLQLKFDVLVSYRAPCICVHEILVRVVH